MKEMNRQGFSLTELLVAIGIVGVLVAASIASYSRVRLQGLDAAAQAHGSTVIQALQGYLALYLSVSPQDLMSGQLRTLPDADYTGAPGGMPGLVNGKNCTVSFTLRDPIANQPTPYSWPAAKRGVGCALGLQGNSFVVYTWAQRSNKFYVNGNR